MCAVRLIDYASHLLRLKKMSEKGSNDDEMFNAKANNSS